MSLFVIMAKSTTHQVITKTCRQFILQIKIIKLLKCLKRHQVLVLFKKIEV